MKEKVCKTSAKTAFNNVIQSDLAEKLENELEQSVAHASKFVCGFVKHCMLIFPELHVELSNLNRYLSEAKHWLLKTLAL